MQVVFELHRDEVERIASNTYDGGRSPAVSEDDV
jgi:hypothetical protein